MKLSERVSRCSERAPCAWRRPVAGTTLRSMAGRAPPGRQASRGRQVPPGRRVPRGRRASRGRRVVVAQRVAVERPVARERRAPPARPASPGRRAAVPRAAAARRVPAGHRRIGRVGADARPDRQPDLRPSDDVHGSWLSTAGRRRRQADGRQDDGRQHHHLADAARRLGTKRQVRLRGALERDRRALRLDRREQRRARHHRQQRDGDRDDVPRRRLPAQQRHQVSRQPRARGWSSC